MTLILYIAFFASVFDVSFLIISLILLIFEGIIKYLIILYVLNRRKHRFLGLQLMHQRRMEIQQQIQEIQSSLTNEAINEAMVIGLETQSMPSCSGFS